MNEAVKLSTLAIGDRFIAVKDKAKGHPKWLVTGKNHFNPAHGTSTRFCRNEDTMEKKSKSGNTMVYKLPLS